MRMRVGMLALGLSVGAGGVVHAQQPAPADKQPPVGQAVRPQETIVGGSAIPEQQAGR